MRLQPPLVPFGVQWTSIMCHLAIDVGQKRGWLDESQQNLQHRFQFGSSFAIQAEPIRHSLPRIEVVPGRRRRIFSCPSTYQEPPGRPSWTPGHQRAIKGRHPGRIDQRKWVNGTHSIPIPGNFSHQEHQSTTICGTWQRIQGIQARRKSIPACRMVGSMVRWQRTGNFGHWSTKLM